MNNKLKNIEEAKNFLSWLKKIITNIRYTRIYEDGDKFVITFTYQEGIKSWSHNCKIVATDSEVYFISRRMMKVPHLERFLNYSNSDSEGSYKVSIKDKWMIMIFLVDYDRFITI